MSSNKRASRTACVRVPQWPLSAAIEARERAGDTVDDWCILLDRHRVVEASLPALAAGIVPGMKKRAAQTICPNVTVLERDKDAEASIFESVATAVDTVASGVEMLGPGLILMHARGPARHAGGEEALASAIVDAVADLTGFECTVGIADGPLAAIIASLTGRIITEGHSQRFLAAHPISALEHAPLFLSERFHVDHRSDQDPQTRADMIEMLQRLGIRTLGDFTSLPASAIGERFGPAMQLAHLLARGDEVAEPPRNRAELPLEVERSLHPGLERIDQAAFIARPMAEELDNELCARSLVCTRLRIVATNEHGEQAERTWRHDGALSAADIVDRVRWQCDAWITHAQLRRRDGDTHESQRLGAITRIQLIPVQLVNASSHAPTLWGTYSSTDRRAERALVRVQSMLGENSVLTLEPGGGRLLTQAVRAVPFKSAPRTREATGPWPGAHQGPYPALVFCHSENAPRPGVALIDQHGHDVVVDSRGHLTGQPAYMRLETSPPAHSTLANLPRGSALEIAAFSAPSIIDQRWWHPQAEHAHRGARISVLLSSGHALILLSSAGNWNVEALYD